MGFMRLRKLFCKLTIRATDHVALVRSDVRQGGLCWGPQSAARAWRRRVPRASHRPCLAHSRRPLLNFFGYWGSPKKVSGGGGSRRLLAEGGSTTDLDSTSTLAPDQAGAAGGGRVSAQSTAWCTTQGWWVEQIAAGRTAVPVDLQAAQAAARQSGRMR